MPKIIGGVKQAIREAAQRTLLEQGYEALNMRQIATECHIALGTAYDYYTSKDEIVMDVLLQAWKQTLERIARRAEQEPALHEGLQDIFEELRRFTLNFHGVWLQRWMASLGGDASRRHYAHPHGFVEELQELIAHHLVQYGVSVEDIEFVSGLLARNFALYALQPDFAYARLDRVVRRILNDDAKNSLREDPVT